MTNLFIFFIAVQIIHFLGTWKLYKKAGRQTWEAAVPVYNAFVLTKIMNRPWWWVILLFIPIINLLMFPAFWVETVRSFGKEKTIHVLLAVFTLGFYIFYLNYMEDVTYKKERQLSPHTKAGEWTTSIVFAVVAATLVHTYFMRPYTIPTSSLEKTLLIGDYLFVSKFHYGARTPKTPLALPMVHDTMPFFGGKKFRSYVKGVSLPYFRFPGLQKIKRNEIVVFNWPADTVRFFRDHSKIHVDKPLDKKSNYVKRCVGIAGDSLEIRDGYVFINGKQTVLPDRAKPQYQSILYANKYQSNQFLSDMGISEFYRFYTLPYKKFNKRIQGVVLDAHLINNDIVEIETSFRFSSQNKEDFKLKENKGKIKVNLTDKLFNKIKKLKSTDSIIKQLHPNDKFNRRIFPHDSLYVWSRDNYGPIYIPKKGDQVVLDAKSIPLYKRIIKEYEGNDLTIDGNTIYVNGEATNTYTFKQDYYWMMGDNRHNSEDARYWGYVPFDHVVGKPVFIWFSIEPQNSRNPKSFFQRIRTERLFTTVHASGEPRSYLIPTIVVAILLWGLSYFRRKRKDK